MKEPLSFRRVLLKLSGEALVGSLVFGFHKESCEKIALAIKDLILNDIQVGVVIGAGNIFRGTQGTSLDLSRITSDYMGMIATEMNGLVLEQTLHRFGQKAVCMTSLGENSLIQRFSLDVAREHLRSGHVVIFSGGTGSPFFTTDTAAALKASEIQADILIKATKVNGVFSKDPLKHKDAIRYEKITFSEVLAQKLEVMDATSIALCMTSKVPILVCNMWATDKFSEVLKDKKYGTLIYF